MTMVSSYFYKEDESICVLNAEIYSLQHIEDPEDEPEKKSFQNIFIKKDGEFYNLKLDKYNRDFDFLRDIDKNKIIHNLNSKLKGKEIIIKAEQNPDHFMGDFKVANNDTYKVGRENFSDILNDEIKALLRSNAVEVDATLVYLQDQSSMLVDYKGEMKQVSLDLLDSSIKKLNKNEKKHFSKFLESLIPQNSKLKLTIGGIHNNSWVVKMLIEHPNGKITNVNSEINTLLDGDIPEQEFKSDAIKFKGLFSEIKDGETIKFYKAGQRFELQIQDIIGLENDNQFYKNYIQITRDFASNGYLEINANRIHERYLNGNISKMQDGKTIHLNKHLISEGLAYAKNDRLKKYEDIANIEYKGVWIGVANKPIPKIPEQTLTQKISSYFPKI